MNNAVFPVTSQPQFWVIVPTYNPGASAWADWAVALKNQNCQPMQVIVVDSGSTDGSVDISQQAGYTVLHVHATDFNHGGTRQWALDQGLEKASQLGQPKPDFVVYLTQDAILAHPNSLQELLSAFQQPQVAAAFGRQMPKPNATWLEAHARNFNYPETSRTVQLQDKASLGIKACFLSNSFAAYRLQALQAMGGFPSNLPMGEDTYTAAKLLLSGQSLHYQASAAVYHSHNYNGTQDFQRMFDTGVFHAQNPWLQQSFGRAEGEGMKLLSAQWQTLRQIISAPSSALPSSSPTASTQAQHNNQPNNQPNPQNPGWLGGSFQLITTNFIKLSAYKLGLAYRFVPAFLRPYFSMSKAFWLQK
jgi:rhamnosyltransferase